MEANQPQFLDDLNEAQRSAVVYCDTPQLVIAGAGSGKTRVLTYKIAYLLTLGLRPWEILALTFTNKAADEMKQRIGSLVGQERAKYIQMGTFHSVFSRILRREAGLLGYTPDFTIYDDKDSQSLIKAIITEKALSDKVYKPSSVASVISRAKSRMITAEQYALDQSAMHVDSSRGTPRIKDIYLAYCQRMKRANAMDFDDLLMLTLTLLRQHPDVCKAYQERWKYVLVDEYQDTNNVQQQIVTLLTKQHQKVCVVGDDAQSIYSFRGANINNILYFKSNYPEVRLFKLERNYRSTQMIVNAANSLIRHNEKQIPKEVYSEKEKGDRILLIRAESDKEEVAVVLREMLRIRRKDRSTFSDFAILYRTNAQSRLFEEEFLAARVPYVIYGGQSFYQRKEIKDTVAYFRLAVNPNDEEAFKRVVNYPVRGIGKVTMDKVKQFALEHDLTLWQVCCSAERYGVALSKPTCVKLRNFCSMILEFQQCVKTKDAYALGTEIVQRSGILSELEQDNTAEAKERKTNVEELVNSMSDFVEELLESGQTDNVGLADFLQKVSLLSDLDQAKANGDEHVTLMTVHSAKGLEFPCVFVVGMEENLFPAQHCVDNPSELEEERRLFYVAITRAEKRCVVTFANRRLRYGTMEFSTVSRFVRELDKGVVEGDVPVASQKPQVSDLAFGRKPWRQGGGQYQNSRPVTSQFLPDKMRRIVGHKEEPQKSVFFKKSDGLPAPSSQPTERKGLKVGGKSVLPGTRIIHNRFGKGTVREILGEDDNTKIAVEFDTFGFKQLLIKFARFEVVD